MQFICYPKCQTCKKALEFLKSKNLAFEIRDIKEEKLSYNELKEMYEMSNLDIKKFFNTSGLKYKELNLKEKLNSMGLDEKLKLLSSDGMLVKRPILKDKDKIIIGFLKEEYDKL